MTCRNRRAARTQRRTLKVCAVAADKVSSTVAEIPKVKANKAKLGEMSPETAKDIYRDMFLGREFEEMCAQMYYRGKCLALSTYIVGRRQSQQALSGT